MDKANLIIIMFISLLSIGCISDFRQKQYSLVDVYSEFKDVDVGKDTRIFFEVNNNAETTLSSKIVATVNRTCFVQPDELSLEKIPPKESIRSYIYLRTQYVGPPYAADYKICINKKFEVKIILQDINGKILDEKVISVGVVPALR